MKPVRLAWLFFALAAAVFLSLPLWAAPKAKSHEECATYADVAIVAAASAKHGISRQRLEAAIPDIYGKGNDDTREIVRLILDRAYAAPPQSPSEWASVLLRMCTERRGDMDGFLGVHL